MTQQSSPSSMRTFLIIWSGQLASTLGTQMTSFAIIVWAWELTGQATPLALLGFFTHTPTIIASIFAGVFVDRWNRKLMMMVGDTVAALSTIVLLILLLTNHLQIWHLYCAGTINGLFGYFQGLASSASVALLVPKQHYVRAGAMGYASDYGAGILAPALAGTLYYFVGLQGILIIDLTTFLIALSTIWSVHIPQPIQSEITRQADRHLKQELTFGFRYLLARPSLLAILIFLMISNLVGNVCSALYPPMILARSNNSAAALANVQAASGVGGLVGSGLLSLWGGPKRRIHGLLIGTSLMNLSGMALGLGQWPSIWVVASFFEAFFYPFFISANGALWLAKVEPDVQGRVFATRYLLAQLASPIGLIMAGPLADYVFEPAMQTNSPLAWLLGGIFGTEKGAGMALQYTLFTFLGVLIGLSGYAVRRLRDVETIVPDHSH